MSMTPKVGSRRVVRTPRRWRGQHVVTAFVVVVAVLSGAVLPAGPAVAAGTVITPDLPSVIPGPPQVLDTGQTWSYPTIHVVVSALLRPVPPGDAVVLRVTGPVFGDFDKHTNPPERDKFRFNLQCAHAGSGEIVAHWQATGFFTEADSAPAAYTCPPAFRLIAGKPIKDWANGWAANTAIIMGVIALGSACLATVVCAASVGLTAGGAAIGGVAAASAVTAIASGIFWRVNADPPDPDYRTVYVPVPVSVPAIAPGPGLSVGAASALENYARAAGEFIKWGRGFYISINRAQGAQDASDTAAFDLQVGAARGYAAHAATALRAWSVLETGLRAALTANGLANEPASASDVAKGQDLVLTSGLPAELVSRLDAAGATAEEKQTVAALAVYDAPAATDLYGLVDPIPETPTIFANLAAAFDAFATSRPPPTVTGLDVASGPAAGGTRVTLTGTHLAGALNVQFGNTDATAVACTDTDCTVTSPPGVGVVDVTVTTLAGTSATSVADTYNYVGPIVTSVSPGFGLESGGTRVAITGTGLSGATKATFGSIDGTDLTCPTDTSCTVTSPMGSGTIDVTVTGPTGTSTTSPRDEFKYIHPVTVLAVRPAAGPALGGNTVTITSDDMSTVSEVRFASRPGTRLRCAGRSCTAAAPPGTGTVDVTVKNPSGWSSVTPDDRYQYLPAGSPNLLPAGDFEPGSGVPDESGTGFEEFDFGKNVGPWQVTSAPGNANAGGVEVVDGSLGQPFTGNQFLAFGEASMGDSSGPAQVTQTVHVVPGHKYTLSFALSGKTFGGSAVKRLQARLGDSSHIFNFDTTGHTAGSQGWVQELLTSTACSPNLSVSLRQLDVGTNGPQVDDVRLVDAGPVRTCRIIPPTVTGLTPNIGPPTGGTVVTVHGLGLAHSTGILFGRKAGTALVCPSDALCRVTAPAGIGVVDVMVNSPRGKSAITPADRYTYQRPKRTLFRPVSMSWVSLTHGFALGTALAGRFHSTVLLRTRDGGRHWSVMGGPPAPVNSTGTGGALNRVRFASDTVGYAFGTGLFSTHDAGRHWRQVSLGRIGHRFSVTSMEISRGRAYVWSPTATGGRLYSSGTRVDRFASVPGISVPAAGGGSVTAGGGKVAVLTLTGQTGTIWIAAAPTVSFTRRVAPCGTMFPSAVAIDGSTALSVVCDGPSSAGGGNVAKKLLTSKNGGRTWATIPGVPQTLHTTALAQSMASHFAIVAVGASGTQVQITRNGGARWTVPLMLPSNSQPGDFGFTDKSHGFLNTWSPTGSQLWRTVDGGLRWTRELFHP